jgi:hypothetical protein
MTKTAIVLLTVMFNATLLASGLAEAQTAGLHGGAYRRNYGDNVRRNAQPSSAAAPVAGLPAPSIYTYPNYPYGRYNSGASDAATRARSGRVPATTRP